MADVLRVPEAAGSGGEVVLSAWLVAENTAFSTGDAVATLETDKAVLDVEAENDGVILKVLADVGDHVEAGGALAITGAPGEVIDANRLLQELGLVPTAPSTPKAPDAVAETSPTNAAPVVAPNAAAGATAANRARLFASPLARRIARESGLDIASIVGSGPGGRITRRDVERELDTRLASSSGSADPAPSPTTPRPVEPSAPTHMVDVPHTRIRRAIAARLVESKRTAPHFYLRGSARVDQLLALREQINDGGALKVSVNDFVLKAVAQAHAAVPAMNVTWSDDAVRQYSSIDISVAVATPNGLVTPVLREIESMSLSRISARVVDFATRARSGRIQPNELEGGTLTVSNLGMYGTEDFAAIINPPQAAILAVGAARKEPVVSDGVLEVGSLMRVTLSVDHRPVDGAVAAEWMRALLSLLEAPGRLLAG
jgi:pyruvate dehydrogenase E2 component (dihydrolipoamide acetyltransferase)